MPCHRLLAGLIALVGVFAMPAASEAAPKWAVRQLPPKPLEGGYKFQAPLSGVSCPTESLCVAVGAAGTVAYSRSPTEGAGRWHVVYPTYDKPKQSCLEEGLSAASCSTPRGSLDAVSCVDESICVAVGYEGSVYASTDPTGGAGAWSVSDLNGSPHLTSVSCPSVSLCVAVSGGRGAAAGTVLTSADPALGGWQAAQLADSPDLRGVSCASTSLCVAVAKGGGIFVSSDPAGGASAWRRVGSPTPRDLGAVSCVAAPLCAAGDAGGNILTSTDPLGGGPFVVTNAAGSVLITGVSCPTATRCVAVDNNSDVLTSTDPTGGPGAWTFENLVPFEAEEEDHGQFVGNALFAASCASTSLCVLVGAESRIFTATRPFAAPVAAPNGAPGKRARQRPRTQLVFAEGFWKYNETRHRRIRARFRFYSRDGARGFVCKADGGRWRGCHSPLRYWVPVGGHHVLRVRAIGSTGLRGPVASQHFSVQRYHRG